MASTSSEGMLTERVVLDDDRERGRLHGVRVVLRLLGYLRPHKPLLAVTIATMFAFTGTLVAIPWLIKTIVDDHIAGGDGDLSGLDLVLLLFGLVVVVHYVADYIYHRSQILLGHAVLYELRVALFEHLLRLSMGFYDRNQVGRVMSRVQNDVRQLQELLSVSVLSLTHALTLVGVTAAMFAMSFRLAAITLTSILVVIPALMLWQHYARMSFVRARQAVADVNAKLQEGLSAVRVIQSLNREKTNVQGFGQANRENLKANLQATKFWAALWPSIAALSALGLALVVFFGGTMVLEGSLEVGVLVAFSLYIQRFFEPVERLARDFGQIERSMVSVARTFEVLDIQPAIQDAPGAVELSEARGEVRYEGVGFHYEPGTPVLNDIDLHIRPGETVALVGPTGAGKTTLASLLLRFYDVTQGRITLDGHDIRDVSQDSLAGQMSVVLQEPYLFLGSVKENIRYNGTRASDAEVVQAATAVGAHDFIGRLESGYDTLLEEGGGNLSVGQRQLISFARALVADPRILILDEATANIDTYSEMLIQRALSELLRDRTALVIAHQLSTIRNADRIVVMNEGRVVEQGGHAELRARGGLYSELQAYSSWDGRSSDGAAGRE